MPSTPSSESGPLLSIQNLQSCFRTGAGLARAVDGVSFDLRKGETFALVGESGSGKSVTALSILRLLPEPAGYIAGGSIRFEGQDLLSLNPEAMRRIRGDRISMIFQEPMTALNPVLTVGHQIMEVLRLHRGMESREARRAGIELLAHVGIPDPEKRFDGYPHQMSGGMRQRAMVAMAIGCHPSLLIADEPTTALDVTVQAQVFDLLRKLRGEIGMAVLLITHDMGVVYENADRVAVMYAGRIVEEASREVLFRDPRHPYTRLLLRSLPSRNPRGHKLATIEGMVPQPTEWPQGCRFANRCPLVTDRCRAAIPPDVQVAPGHRAACILLQDRQEAITLLDKPTPPSPKPEITSAHRLTVEDLKIHFPVRKGILQRVVAHVRAVDGVDLFVRPGETLALVGESGCGKTTVGRGITRLIQPTAGRVLMDGANIANLPRHALKPCRRKIQIVFQDPQSSIDPRMTIGDVIAEGMIAHDIGRDEADRAEQVGALLDRVGLPRLVAKRYPHQLSGGQRQRIVLARALAMNPAMIICDEATSSLDVSVQAQVLNLLKDLQAERGLSYLFITHDMGVVRYLSDRVAVMYLGRIVEEGLTEELFNNPSHPYTRALLAAVPRIGADGQKRIVLEGDVPSPLRPPAGCHFHPRCPHVMPQCRERYPDAFSFSETHCAKCWLYGR